MARTRMLLLSVLVGFGCADAPADPLPMLAEGVTPSGLAERVDRFAPARLGFDTTGLSSWEWAVLDRLVQASDVVHEIFRRQVDPRVPVWLQELEDAEGRGRAAALAYYGIMVGPWDRLRGHEPFLDVGPKPPGAGYYPPDMTAERFDAWLEEHPEDREPFESNFTVIREGRDGLEAIPYADMYAPLLDEAARLLRAAADLSENASLSAFLRARADAFLSNDYYESDVAWMDIVDSRIEPTIGPYEVYEDRLLGYKAAFESFVTVVDAEASAELDTLKTRLRFLEERLPIPDRYKNLDRGFESPIRVVDAAYLGGDARAGVQTMAFNLPNDERVRSAKGSKKVMLRNVSQAKFNRILVPIAERTSDTDVVDRVSFRPWFTAVLMHELAHGLGPGFIEVEGGRTTVNQALREHYSALEEAKADVVGLYNLTVLEETGLYDAAFVRRAFASHVPDFFRAVRFGTTEAHGLANMVQFNWHMERGALTYNEATGKFSVNLQAMMLANRELAERILMIQARGDYEAAGALLAEYGTVGPELERAMERIRNVPVDVRPLFVVRDYLPGGGDADANG